MPLTTSYAGKFGKAIPFSHHGITYEEIMVLRQEINILTIDIGYWKKQHECALEREKKLQTELADKIAKIKYREHQLYAKKTEKSHPKNKPEMEINPKNRGRQKGTPGHPFQDRQDGNLDRINRIDKKKYVQSCRHPQYFIHHSRINFTRKYFMVLQAKNSSFQKMMCSSHQRKFKDRHYENKKE